jgi:hypothetical protein
MALTLELKTAAVCLIQRGNDPKKVINGLYEFLDGEGIRYPDQESQASLDMWRRAVDRATPKTCTRILGLTKDNYQL